MPDTIRLEQIELGSSRLKTFVDVPWKLMRGDPCWTPPLKADLLGNKALGMVGLLTSKHVYHRTADVTHWIAWRGKQPVGTISAAINHRFNEYHGTKLGFFGFFDVAYDYDAANALLDAARAWIAERGMTAMRGPGQYSCATHERQGVLVEGFVYPPMVELTHNPPYYGPMLEAYGLAKVKDYVAYLVDIQAPVPEKVVRTARLVRARHPEITTRPADLARLDEEIALLVELYNDSWKENWGFLPVLPEEADALADQLRPIVDPAFIRFAYVDGVPAATFGAIPDPYYVIRPRWHGIEDTDMARMARLLASRHRIPRGRMMFFGIRPPFRALGIDALLYEETQRTAAMEGYQQCDASMLLEDNVMIRRACESMGGRCYKTWRLYEMPV